MCVCVSVAKSWKNSKSFTVHQYSRTCPYMFTHTVLILALLTVETQHMQYLSMQALCERADMRSLYLARWTNYTVQTCRFLFPSQPLLRPCTSFLQQTAEWVFVTHTVRALTLNCSELTTVCIVSAQYFPFHSNPIHNPKSKKQTWGCFVKCR